MSDLALQDAFSPAQLIAASEPAPKAKTVRLNPGVPFTRETAKLYAQRSLAARRAKAERAKLNPEPPEPAPAPEPEEDSPELAIALRELKRVSVALAGKMTVRERCDLTDRLDMLLDRVRVLRGQPLPGTMTSRAPAPAPSTGARMLEAAGGSPAPISAPVPREEQE